MNPKVTIIIVSHNRPLYLQQAIDSIKNQTMKSWELIIIDDFSTDKKVDKVLIEAEKSDERIKYFRTGHDVNNLSILWNLGIDNSKGEYICTLDDDNMKGKDFCKKLSEWLDNHQDYDAVCCLAHIMQLDKVVGLFDMPLKMNKYNIRKDNHVDSGCMMYRRTMIDKIGYYDERLKTSEDWDFVIRIVLETKGFGIINKPLTYYRWHETNRLKKAVLLGDLDVRDIILKKKNYDKNNILLFHQDKSYITQSQNNVLDGVTSALKKHCKIDTLSLSGFKRNKPSKIYDVILCFAPFCIPTEYIEKISQYGVEIASLNIEDPQAINLNVERSKYFNYIFTNDVSLISQYEKIIGNGRVCFCPSLSFDNINLKCKNVKNKKGIVFFGHGYESRQKFMSELKPKLKRKGYKIDIIGGGWNNATYNETKQQKALELLEKYEIVILRNREKTDLNGKSNSINPLSLDRGYFEAASGSLIMIDSIREHHSFNGDVIFYDDVNHLIEKIDYYTENKDEALMIGKEAKRKALKEFTYSVRMKKLINYLKSQRHYMEIE